MKLLVSAGYVQPPPVIPMNATSLHFEARAANISFATRPSANCFLNPSPLVLGSTCYNQRNCNPSSFTCPNDGSLSTDFATFCTCRLACSSSDEECNCGVKLADITTPNQCPSSLPTLSGCYCTNKNASVSQRFVWLELCSSHLSALQPTISRASWLRLPSVTVCRVVTNPTYIVADFAFLQYADTSTVYVSVQPDGLCLTHRHS